MLTDTSAAKPIVSFQLSELVRQVATAAAYLVICDHWQEPGRSSFLTRKLQHWDRGKFVRPIGTFEQLEGYATLRQLELESRFLGVTLWPYFCSLYQPLR